MKRALTILTLSLVVLLSSLSAQEKRNLTNDEIQNLKFGIQSENTGLKRSSIYFAGYYKIEEAADILRDEMLRSNDPNIQLLAALALYEIGDRSFLSDVNVLANDKAEDLKVRRMAKAISDEWKANLKQSVVSISH